MRLSTELLGVLAGGVVGALLVRGTVAWWPHRHDRPMSLLLCDAASLRLGAQFDTAHCVRHPLQLESPEACHRAEDAVAWAIGAGLDVRPVPWVRMPLVTVCRPSDQAEASGRPAPSDPAGALLKNQPNKVGVPN